MQARFATVGLVLGLIGTHGCWQRPNGGQASTDSGGATVASVTVLAPDAAVLDPAPPVPSSAAVPHAVTPVPEATSRAPGCEMPESPKRQPACSDQRKTATRWLASNPRVPLAISDSASIAGFFTDSVREAGQPCCASWAATGSRWRGVDAWGQVVGTATVEGSDFYDVTRCQEMYFQPESVDERAVVYASQRGSWKPPPSVEWTPTPPQIAGLHRMLGAMDSLHVSPEREIDVTDYQKRPRFYFELPICATRPDVNADRRSLFAVVGGPYLVIASVGSGNAWHVAHVDGGEFYDVVYTPLAVFDLDGDGFPEVIYKKRQDGSWWNDVVLSVFPQDRGVWKQVAKSVGGSTA